MKQVLYTVASNRPLTADVWEMALTGDTSAITAPGQFVNIKLEGLYLRRPISVCRWDEQGLTILYKVVGRGTEAMTRLAPGAVLDTLSGLGNGYDVAACPDRVAVIGGGVGVPPMYGLAQPSSPPADPSTPSWASTPKARSSTRTPSAPWGRRSTVTTVDGSYGTKGFVTAAMGPGDAYACACGPLPMLKAVYGALRRRPVLL